MSQPSTVAKRHQVVITGSGFADLTAAKATERADVNATVISKITSHSIPAIALAVATGISSEGDIAPDHQSDLRKEKNVRVSPARSSAAGTADQTARGQSTATIPDGVHASIVSPLVGDVRHIAVHLRNEV